MPNILPSPNFAWNPVTNPPRAGIRPKRDVTYRLEPEPHDGRLIVHNYGHAGAGITMSWGCAYEVAKIILDSGHAAGERVAVLGGGVMGLTAAVVLSEQHFDVTVYAKAFPPDTTSNVAGGQWAPASVQHNNKTQFERILKKAFDTHLAKGTAYGVSPKLNYATHELPSFQDVPHNIIMPPNTVVAVPTKLQHLPFAKLNSKGVVYSTLLVEPPIFLPKLISDLENIHVQRIKKTLGPMNQVLQDPDITQKIIVNCTGLGSKDICGDKKLHGVKGQLAMLPAQPALDYLFCAPGYLFPRKDAVVVGGTEEPEGTYTDDKPDIAECKRILAKVRAAFEPTMVDMLMPNFLAAKLGPKYFIQGK